MLSITDFHLDVDELIADVDPVFESTRLSVLPHTPIGHLTRVEQPVPNVSTLHSLLHVFYHLPCLF